MAGGPGVKDDSGFLSVCFFQASLLSMPGSLM